MRDVCTHANVSGGSQYQDDIKLATSLVGKERKFDWDNIRMVADGLSAIDAT